jgi:hypothetical protein
MRNRLEKPALGHHPECQFRSTRAEEFVELFDQSCRRAAGDLSAMVGDSGIDRRIDRKPEPRGHRNRAQHAHGVFMKTLYRVTNGANEPRAQVFEAAGVVDDGKRSDVVEQSVDRKVAPERVLLRRPERVLTMDQRVGTWVPVLWMFWLFAG